MNFIQKIAIRWYLTFDANGLLYHIAKSFNKSVRYLIYILFPTALYFTMSFFGSLIDLQHTDLFLQYPLFVVILILIGKFGVILATLFSAFIFSYEFILDIPIDDVLNDIKDERIYKKKNKLQWWRLRNMTLIWRLSIYILVYFFILNIVQISFIGALGSIQTVNINEVQQAFREVLTWITFIYICVVLGLDYFASKKRSKK